MFTGMSVAGLIALILVYCVFKSTIFSVKENAENVLKHSATALDISSSSLVSSAKQLKSHVEKEAAKAILEDQQEMQEIAKAISAQTEEEKKSVTTVRDFINNLY